MKHKIFFLLLLSLGSCASEQKITPSADVSKSQGIRNEILLSGRLSPSQGPLFDLTKEDFDSQAVGAFEVEQPRANHIIKLTIEADGPFEIEIDGPDQKIYWNGTSTEKEKFIPLIKGRYTLYLKNTTNLKKIRGTLVYMNDDRIQPKSRMIKR